MKQFWKEAGVAVILGMIMPGVILQIVTYSAQHHIREPEKQENVAKVQEEGECADILLADGTVASLEMEEYITGVVLAEMPASFETEALKAQAVVARTYTYRAISGRGKHTEAALCTDSSCCQAYISPEAYELSGSGENVRRIRAAVRETAGMVLTYEQELIEATYFSCSGGMTEDAVAVWGTDVAYLRSVPSPGEENAAYYTDQMTFTPEELSRLLDLELEGDPANWFSQMEYTAGGGVARVQICGVEFLGTEVRKLLNLRSTAFSVTASADSMTFHTRGFGHRVGMSQYGADAMAESGADYREILAHYYPGTVLQVYSD